MTARSSLKFKPVNFSLASAAIEFIRLLKDKFNRISIQALIIQYDALEHWNDRNAALNDFAELKRIIVEGRKMEVRVVAAKLKQRMDTPYYHLFEELNK